MKFADSHGRVKQLILPKALDLDRPKRARTWFNTSQLDVLESEYQKNPYVTGEGRKLLAKRLGLSETQVIQVGNRNLSSLNHLNYRPYIKFKEIYSFKILPNIFIQNFTKYIHIKYYKIYCIYLKFNKINSFKKSHMKSNEIYCYEIFT